jgi:hypothetical protein
MLEAIPERRYMPSTTPCFSMNSVQLLSTWGTGAGSTMSENTRHPDNFKKGTSTSINRGAPEHCKVEKRHLLSSSFLKNEHIFLLREDFMFSDKEKHELEHELPRIRRGENQIKRHSPQVHFQKAIFES